MAPAVKMPSMPKLRTPARSQISSPSVPKMSGVAMRSAAPQSGAVKNIPSASGRAGSRQPEPITGDHAADQDRQERGRDDQIGDIARDLDGAAHGIGADKDRRDKEGG